MKRYTVQTLLIYFLALIVGCFLNLDKLAPWYRMQSMDAQDPVVKILDAAQTLRDISGVTRGVDAFDCSFAFLFNEIYKDNSKCLGSDFQARPPLLDSHDNQQAVAPRSQNQRGFEAASPAKRVGARQGTLINTDYSYGNGFAPGLNVLPAGMSNSELNPDLVTKITASRNELGAPPRSILIVGDSLSLGLATPFQRALKEYNADIDFAQVGKVSSGLTIPHLFDWDKKVQVLINQYKPDILIVMMGVNDANNNIYIDNKKAILGTPDWPKAYQQCVKRFISIIAGNNIPIYWISVPVVRDTDMSKRIQIANKAAYEACDSFEPCHFVDTAQILTDDNGAYTNYKKDKKGYKIRIRAKDGIHFSADGGDLLSRYILDYISNFVELRPHARSENPL